MTARTLRLAFGLGLLVGCSSSALAQSITNAGKEFIVGFLPNHSGANAIQLHLTAPEDTQVTVNYPVNSPTFETTIDVTAGDITIVDLPVEAAGGWTDNAIANNAVLAFSPTDDNFVCYMINIQTSTSDAGLALPLSALNREYIVTTHSASDAEYVVVAAYDDTDVTISPPGGGDIEITLNRGQGYMGVPGGDATGTIISASRPVSVTNGNKCASFGDGACDHVFEVAVPIAAWGTSIPVANIPENSGGTRYKIVASTDSTTVTRDGTTLGTIDRGEFIYTDKFADDHIIAADNPIFVTQFMDNRGSFGGDPTGDPAIGNMVPGAQYMSSYTFSTVGGGQFLEHYLTIIAANDDVGALTLDDVAVDAGDFSAIPDSGFSVARIIITDDVHSTASDSGHGIMVMGFNSCDSYLYPGGAMFEFINPGGDPWDPVCDCALQEGPPKVFECTATDNHPAEGDDEDTGIFFVALLDGATNIELDVDEFTPGDGEVTYRVQRTDEEADGSGTVRVTDGAGNTCEYEISLTAAADSATVTTAAISDITTTTATSGGNVTADGGANVTARGVCWSTLENPTIADDTTEDGTGTGVFTSNMSGLTAATPYYVRAYATNSAGTAYGADVTFATVAEEPEPEPEPEPDPELAPDLRVTIEAQTDADALVGDDVAFTATVENVGTATATDVVLTIPIPENAEFVSARLVTDPSAQTADLVVTLGDEHVTLEFGDVSAGDSLQVEIVFRVTAAGEVTVDASATSEEVTTPKAAETAATIDAEDEYLTVAQTTTPVYLCGALGFAPLLVLASLIGTKLRRRRRPEC